MKYGMPSAKYNVGIHHQGDLPVTLPVMENYGLLVLLTEQMLPG